MNNFEHFCYLIVCRQQANLARKRALYRCSCKFTKNNKTRFHIAIKKIKQSEKERNEYRAIADSMRKIAVKTYSPLRRKLKAYVHYNANNSCVYAHYNGINYSYESIKKIAEGYEFENIVLTDDKKLKNPYRRIV